MRYATQFDVTRRKWAVRDTYDHSWFADAPDEKTARNLTDFAEKSAQFEKDHRKKIKK